jgi:methyl-accepting chemotaxis protein
LSDKVIKNRRKVLPWYKNLEMKQSIELTVIEHSTLKWEIYNVLCGFTKLTAHDIQSHTECNIGKIYEGIKNKGNQDALFINLYETHKKLHLLAKDIAANHTTYTRK